MHPILFHIGSFPVRSYGLMFLLAFIVGTWLVRRRAANFGFEPNKVTDLCFWMLIVGILGARVLFILQELPHYSKHLDEVFSLKFEGLTSFGALFAGGALVIGWAYLHKVRLSVLADLLAAPFLLGSAIGRIGCFLNGCCYGRACDATTFLAVNFWDESGQRRIGYHIPAQLYDSGMDFLFLGLVLLYERRRYRPGQGIGAVLFCYGLARFIYEFWRAGSQSEVDAQIASSTYWGHLPITQAQAVALLLMVAGFVLWLLGFQKRGGPEDPAAYVGSPPSTPPMVDSAMASPTEPAPLP